MATKWRVVRWVLAFAGCLGAFGNLAAAGQPGGRRVFRLDEVSVFDYEGPMADMLRSGAYARSTSHGEPDWQVKAYPAFKSDKPFYGVLTVDMSLVDYGAGTDYRFAVDESEGTGKGYDRLYFDGNHDLDLTNDAPVKVAANPPKGVEVSEGIEQTWFEEIAFDVQYRDGSEAWPVKLVPRLMVYGPHSGGMMSFTCPTVRRGKVTVAGKEYDVLLTQASMVTGRYDRPVTYLFLGEESESVPLVCLWRNIEGRLYRFLPSPAGDEIRVRRYRGDFGILEVGETPRSGWLVSREAMVDLGQCEKVERAVRIPVGDYKPIRLSFDNGSVRVALAAEQLNPGDPVKPQVFGISIREDESWRLSLSDKPQVVFKSPAATETVRPGQELKVQAMLRDPGLDVLIAGIEDMSRKMGEPVAMPDGTPYQRYETLDPRIRLVGSSGDVLAEGKMPFG